MPQNMLLSCFGEKMSVVDFNSVVPLSAHFSLGSCKVGTGGIVLYKTLPLTTMVTLYVFPILSKLKVAERSKNAQLRISTTTG